MLCLKSISSTSSRLACSSLPVVYLLDSGVIMLVLRLLEEFLHWCLSISIFKCCYESLGSLFGPIFDTLPVYLIFFLGLPTLKSPHHWGCLSDPLNPEIGPPDGSSGIGSRPLAGQGPCRQKGSLIGCRLSETKKLLQRLHSPLCPQTLSPKAG